MRPQTRYLGIQENCACVSRVRKVPADLWTTKSVPSFSLWKKSILECLSTHFSLPFGLQLPYQLSLGPLLRGRKQSLQPTHSRGLFFFLIEERLHNANEQWVPFPASPRKGLLLDWGRKEMKFRLFRNQCWDEENSLSHVAGEESQNSFPITDPRFPFKHLWDLAF